MLDEKGIEYNYREYTKEPLSVEEIQHVLKLLDMSPKEVLRRRDAAFKSLGLTGDEDDDVLIGHMAENPTLLQRPIGVVGDRAAVGRPPDNLLALV